MRGLEAGFIMILISANISHASGAPELKSMGMFIKESTLPGETRRDDVVPRHAVCLQAAKSRWLIIYTTHGYRGADDERSVLYQVRKDAPDGAVLKEGFLAKSINDWRPEAVP